MESLNYFTSSYPHHYEGVIVIVVVVHCEIRLGHKVAEMILAERMS